MKKMLMLASVASMIDQFNMPNIQLLLEMGFEVHVACNFEKGSTCTEEKIAELKNKLTEMNVKYFQVDFNRNVLKIYDDLRAYKQVLKLARHYQYKFIHCHSPIGGVVGRLVGHKTHTKVIYTAHGFHFYKGAPIQNWVLYYPIEKFLSRYTDILITINKEDYKRAINKFFASRVEYVPGIGVDLKKFRDVRVNKNDKRIELGLKEKDKVLLSVGELNKNKNHEVVIKAIKKIDESEIKYLIVGQGKLKNYLKKLVKELGLEKQVLFLGFRSDVAELYKIADIFVFPSKREGLSVALIEALASGLTCVVSAIRGNVDLIKDDTCIFRTGNIDELTECLKINLLNGTKKATKKNMNESYKNIHKCDLSQIRKIMISIYKYVS